MNRSHISAGMVLVLIMLPLSAAALERPARSASTEGASNSLVVPGEVIIKFAANPGLAKSAVRTGIAGIDAIVSQLDVQSIERALPFLRSGKPAARELRNVYCIRYGSDDAPAEVAKRMARNPAISWAEPRYLHRVTDTPNDPSLGSQGYLSQLNAQAAWDLVKGEQGEVVIAVVDGGTDWRHPDLAANIWSNPGEIAGNGIDDDNNGFVDDVRGWNFANDSNDPTGLAGQSLNGLHGTHVAGVVAAVTNNDFGVSSLSWNCRVMPINGALASGDSLIAFTYEGIAYAAENGANIVNTSVGSSNRSILAQEVINMAHELGTLVVASAGNEASDSDRFPRYPANYDHVLSVGATGTTIDRRAGFSNFGVSVDIYAPGVGILSTAPGSAYQALSGTSFSSPVAAALAGLIKTKHPGWSGDQVREQLRVTGRNIDSANPGFAGRLGKGLIDPVAALTREDGASVRIAEASAIDSDGDETIARNEPATLRVDFTNFLRSTGPVDVTLSSSDARVEIPNPNMTLPALNTGDTLRAEFAFSLREDVGESAQISFFADIASGSYTDRDHIVVTLNPPQILNLDTGVLETTVTRQGNIGYVGFAGETPGVGFVLDGVDVLFEGGLMIGTSSNSVSDCIRGPDGGTQLNDFLATTPLDIVSPGEFANQESAITLIDSLADNPIGIAITQDAFAFNKSPFDQFVIIRYRFRNLGKQTVSNFHAGLFFDWDINVVEGSGVFDFARFEAPEKLAYVSNRRSNPDRLAAVKVLTSTGAIQHRSIHNPDEIYDGYTKFEKWIHLSSGVQTQSLDSTDVSTITGAGPFTLAPDETVEIAFALIGAASLGALQDNATAAQLLWDSNLNDDLDVAPPVISASVFQNPAAPRYADAVVVADKALAQPGPIVRLAAGTDTTTIEMQPINGSATQYSGKLFFPGDGSYRLLASATALFNGLTTSADRDFQLQTALPGANRNLSFRESGITLLVPAGAIQRETPFLARRERIDGDWHYRLGPVVRFEKELEIRLPAGGTAGEARQQIYRETTEGWEPLPTWRTSDGAFLSARTAVLGKFKTGPGSAQSLPESYALHQNYPNPFNPETVISFDLPADTHVSLTVFNALGQRVRTLTNEMLPAGRHLAAWDGRFANGVIAPSGLYFYQIETDDFRQTHKMLLVR